MVLMIHSCLEAYYVGKRLGLLDYSRIRVKHEPLITLGCIGHIYPISY